MPGSSILVVNSRALRSFIKVDGSGWTNGACVFAADAGYVLGWLLRISSMVVWRVSLVVVRVGRSGTSCIGSLLVSSSIR